MPIILYQCKGVKHNNDNKSVHKCGQRIVNIGKVCARQNNLGDQRGPEERPD